MKKIFTLVAMALMAVGVNAQTLIAEKDWTGVTELPGFVQFESDAQGSAEMVADGISITVNSKTGQLWQPQVSVLEGFDLAIDGNYRVVITAKLPSDGQMQINMGDWSVNTQYDFAVTSTGDFQEISYDFLEYPGDATNAHVLFQCGDFLGTSIVKKVQVFDLDGEGGEEPGGEEETVDITSNFTYTWNENESIEVNDDGSITFNAVSWGGLAAWVAVDDVPVDWSGYSKVVFEYAEPTEVNTQILVGDAKAWGEVGITSLECPFDGVDMSAISQIALQASDATTIVVKRVYLVKAGATGIQSIQAAKAQDGAIYNLAGQKVNASYKGVVIKNGKKYFQK